MKFITLLSLAVGALAIPTYPKPLESNCLTSERAAYIVNQTTIFLQHFDVAAAKAVAETLYGPSFKEYGDSINSLRGDPLGTLVEPNGEVYINNTLSTPPIAVINSLAVLNNCTHIFWQYQFYGIGGPMAPNRINGFVLIEVNNTAEYQPILSHYVEFNSLAWAENVNFTVIPPTTGEYAPQASKLA